MAPRAANGRAALRRPRGQLPAVSRWEWSNPGRPPGQPRATIRSVPLPTREQPQGGQPRGARRPLLTWNARLLLSANSIRQLHQAHAGASFPTPTIVAQTMHLQVRAQALSGVRGPEAGLVEGLGRSDTEADTPFAVRAARQVRLWRRSVCSGPRLRQPSTDGCLPSGLSPPPACRDAHASSSGAMSTWDDPLG